MDGNSCKLWVVLNVHGADVCTRVSQSETDPSGATLGRSHHITVASLSTELNTNICLTVFALQLKGKKKAHSKGTVITTADMCYILCVHHYLSCVCLTGNDHQLKTA